MLARVDWRQIDKWYRLYEALNAGLLRLFDAIDAYRLFKFVWIDKVISRLVVWLSVEELATSFGRIVESSSWLAFVSQVESYSLLELIDKLWRRIAAVYVLDQALDQLAKIQLGKI